MVSDFDIWDKRIAKKHKRYEKNTVKRQYFGLGVNKKHYIFDSDCDILFRNMYVY